jgi:glutathione synthase/RimK-type ligase-like ATP-grasp enzyme
MQAWTLAHPAVRVFNREVLTTLTSKPHVLVLARECGLEVPRTLITNHLSSARGAGPRSIAKPVAGGELTLDLDEAVRRAGETEVLPSPAIVQERLEYPERRVFVVGRRTFAFELRSPHLDHRASPDVDLIYVGEAPTAVRAPLLALASRLRLDFAAADFKSRPSGEVVFLEINSGPMFSRFDDAAGGAVSTAMAEWLTSRDAAERRVE